MRTPRASRHSFEESERSAQEEATEARSQCLAMLYQQRALLDLARRSETQLAELQTEKAALAKRADAAQEQSDSFQAQLQGLQLERGSSQAQLERSQADAVAALEKSRRADERAEATLARATSAEETLRAESAERSRLAAEVAAREGALAGGAAEKKLLEEMVRWLETQLRCAAPPSLSRSWSPHRRPLTPLDQTSDPPAVLRLSPICYHYSHAARPTPAAGPRSEAKAEAAAARAAQDDELSAARRETERLGGVETELRAALGESAARLGAVALGGREDKERARERRDESAAELKAAETRNLG